MKQNQNQIIDPWENDIAFFIKKGMQPELARVFTINSWTLMGDLRPLRAELAEPTLDRAFFADQILSILAKLIDEDRLTVKPNGGGRPRPPDKFSRDIAAGQLYEREIAVGDKSAEEALKVVGEFLGMTDDNVRKVVTWFRKNWTVSEK